MCSESSIFAFDDFILGIVLGQKKVEVSLVCLFFLWAMFRYICWKTIVIFEPIKSSRTDHQSSFVLNSYPHHNERLIDWIFEKLLVISLVVHENFNYIAMPQWNQFRINVFATSGNHPIVWSCFRSRIYHFTSDMKFERVKEKQ